MRIDAIGFDDPRLAHYRNLKDRELARDGGRFLAESEFVVRRLLASSITVESVVVADRKAAQLAPVVPPHVPLYVLPDSVLDDLVGFKFHTGVLAVGIRPASPPLEALAPDKPTATLAVCPDLTNLENLGSIVRTAVAFGVDGLLIGPRCCDPYFRLAVRVSMGTLFKIPVVRSQNIPADLALLRQRHGYRFVATVIDPTADTLPDSRPARCGILFGNEAVGLTLEDIAACDHKVTLPMSHGTDSLNVAVTAGILLHHYARRAAG